MTNQCKYCGRIISKRPSDAPRSCRPCWLKNMPKGKDRTWNWKSGETKTSNGYICICINDIEDKNLSDMCRKSVLNRAYGKNRNGRIYKHHIEMIKKIGRPLEKGEVIHHKDGNKNNNNIDNLVLTNQKDHVKDYRDLLFKVKKYEELYGKI